jgi:hypothetical protein
MRPEWNNEALNRLAAQKALPAGTSTENPDGMFVPPGMGRNGLRG